MSSIETVRLAGKQPQQHPEPQHARMGEKEALFLVSHVSPWSSIPPRKRIHASTIHA
jgi:hypothetical protein